MQTRLQAISLTAYYMAEANPSYLRPLSWEAYCVEACRRLTYAGYEPPQARIEELARKLLRQDEEDRSTAFWIIAEELYAQEQRTSQLGLDWELYPH